MAVCHWTLVKSTVSPSFCVPFGVIHATAEYRQFGSAQRGCAPELVALDPQV
ncbi:hypothetical protein [Mycobacteroides abscessus]|uniref:hypothetical protein n=1 Tax=Mycobacteroides abscessus TaxID=36809 RepID=UPI0004259F79|nr:hypothetical protein [Mycobacteroides abscessus]MBN7549391.1 hypothetical protein [Mycobacteroides abscessus subsp. abscessus]MDM2697101.1 hypothetical protein [Mycobacteroides abscessus]MDO3265701.1 hypothetical protein [Mycobacteroides abscessus subsp. abscessus]